MKYLAALFILLTMTACGQVNHGSTGSAQKASAQPAAPQAGQTADLGDVTPILVDAEGTCQWTKFAAPFDTYYSQPFVEGFDVFTCNQYQPACQVFKDNQTESLSTNCPELPAQKFEVPNE